MASLKLQNAPNRPMRDMDDLLVMLLDDLRLGLPDDHRVAFLVDCSDLDPMPGFDSRQLGSQKLCGYRLVALEREESICITETGR